MTKRATSKRKSTFAMEDYSVEELHGLLEAGETLSREAQWWLLARIGILEREALDSRAVVGVLVARSGGRVVIGRTELLRVAGLISTTTDELKGELIIGVHPRARKATR